MNAPSTAAPGLTFKYSDINFITLGALVEKLSGQPLDVYAQQHIFTPLGMTDTRYLPIDKPAARIKIHPAAREYALDCHPARAATSSTYACPAGDWSTGLRPAHRPHRPRRRAQIRPRPTRLRPSPPRHRPRPHHPPHGRSSRPRRRLLHRRTTSRSSPRPCSTSSSHNTGPFPLKQSTLQAHDDARAARHSPTSLATPRTIFTVTAKRPAHQRRTRIHDRTARLRLGHQLRLLPPARHDLPHRQLRPHRLHRHLPLDRPGSDTYVILLANAIHPRGNPPISALRGEVATAAAQALQLYTDRQSSATTA